MSIDAEQSAADDCLQILEEHRKNCEQHEKYIEAEIAEKRIEELKADEYKRQQDSMRASHIAVKLKVEESTMLEIQQITSKWNNKINDYNEKSEILINSMKERHSKELNEFQVRLVVKQQKPKFSSQLLNYKKVEEHLVKSKNYSEAHKIKTKADQLEILEKGKWMKRKKKEMLHQNSQFSGIKQQEFAALQKRTQAGMNEQKKQKQLSLERALRRCKNIKNELETQQKFERIHMEKQNDSRGTKHEQKKKNKK